MALYSLVYRDTGPVLTYLTEAEAQRELIVATRRLGNPREKALRESGG